MKKHLLVIAFTLIIAALVAVSCHWYIKTQATKHFIELLDSIKAERDTTHSLRNYEVLTDSINNLYNMWHGDEDNK